MIADPFLTFIFMVSCAARAILVVLVIPFLILFPEQFRLGQRIGLALAASGSLMMVPILYMGRGQTPFDGWASLMETVGLCIYLWGTSHRLYKHHWGNMLQVRSMERELKDRRGE